MFLLQPFYITSKIETDYFLVELLILVLPHAIF